MEELKQIFTLPTNEQVKSLTRKSLRVPRWLGEQGLINEYDPNLHPVNNRNKYPDVVRSNGTIEKVSRIALGFQQLAVKRMTELIVGIPVQRAYNTTNKKQEEIASVIEKIFKCNRIDALNIERCNLLYAGCELFTLWYAVSSSNNLYGTESKIKLRCKNFSPIKGDELYPLFDSYEDLIALSVKYQKHISKEQKRFYLDTYTSNEHIRYESSDDVIWQETQREQLSLGKLPAVYVYRPSPIWENTSNIVYEIEWALSRNGNYLRANSRPLFGLFTDEAYCFGNEGDTNTDFKGVLQFPKDAQARYITWEQAVDSLKFYINELRGSYFTQLQLPDWSFETMKTTPMSGESRKQLYIDAQLKVLDESGRLLEFFDREINVIKSFVKAIMPTSYSGDIDALEVETIITPYTMTDEKDKITNLMSATGGKPIISQKEAIKYLGWSTDIEQTLREIKEDEMLSAVDLAR